MRNPKSGRAAPQRSRTRQKLGLKKAGARKNATTTPKGLTARDIVVTASNDALPAPSADSVSDPPAHGNGATLEEEWELLATYLKTDGSELMRWLRVRRMHALCWAQKRKDRPAPKDATLCNRVETLTLRSFADEVRRRANVSVATVYRWVERAQALVACIGEEAVEDLVGNPIANDKELLIKLPQLPRDRALRVVAAYTTGAGSAHAEREFNNQLLHHRLATLTRTTATPLVGGRSGAGIRDVVLYGDAVARLKELPDASVQTVSTSPPYWGQRDFGTRHWFGGDLACTHDHAVDHASRHPGQVEQTKWRKATAAGKGQTATTSACSKCGAWYGQLGLEPTPQAFVAHLVDVFREVKRVLRDDGTLWLNLGDSYFGDTPPRKSSNEAFSKFWDSSNTASRGGTRRSAARVGDLKPKDLVGIPWMVAFALRADGWHLRSEVIWAKGSPMPEAVQDRPTRSHEHVFLLTKSSDYYYDHHAIMDPTTGTARPGGSGRGRKEATVGGDARVKASASFHRSAARLVTRRNSRDVWSFAPEKFPGAHSATFPSALPKRCILAATSEKGACAECGTPWRRVVVNEAHVVRDKQPAKYAEGGMRAGRLGSARDAAPAPSTIGWEPTCACGCKDVVPCLVLDPFAGSGTTLAVAKQLGRSYVGTELNETDYRPLIDRRLANVTVPAPAVDDESPAKSARRSRRRARPVDEPKS